MNPALLAAALVVAAGAVVCVSARDARVALAGLAATLVAAPFLADPLPGPLPIAARVVAALLAVYLPWILVREPGSITRGSLLGLPVETLVAAAAFVIGYGTAGLGAPALGPSEAQAAGFALIALAVGPLVFSRDVFRSGSGAALLLGGVLLVRSSLAGSPGPLEELVTGALFIALGGAVSFLISSAAEAGVSGGEALVAAATEPELPAARRRSTMRSAGGGR
ncbi:MAG TPA: hypothetical protein VK656_06150 [Candidatus Acidoferrum sp.]|nr:hypothetical protein [Candidatus Acidoferrum sp.]